MKNRPALKQKFDSEIKKKLKAELGLKNSMAIPTITKIVLNSGLGKAKDDSSIIEQMQKEMSLIVGQKVITTKAKKSISNFKIREGMPIGVKVTLRKDKMWIFLDKLINIVFPRVRDFRGLSPKAFDGNGNYSLGIIEHTVFPEIDPNKVTQIKSLQITINTSTKNQDEAYKLLKFLGLPFKK